MIGYGDELSFGLLRGEQEADDRPQGCAQAAVDYGVINRERKGNLLVTSVSTRMGA
jgi:hypothetical protein